MSIVGATCDRWSESAEPLLVDPATRRSAPMFWPDSGGPCRPGEGLRAGLHRPQERMLPRRHVCLVKAGSNGFIDSTALIRAQPSCNLPRGLRNHCLRLRIGCLPGIWTRQQTKRTPSEPVRARIDSLAQGCECLGFARGGVPPTRSCSAGLDSLGFDGGRRGMPCCRRAPARVDVLIPWQVHNTAIPRWGTHPSAGDSAASRTLLERVAAGGLQNFPNRVHCWHRTTALEGSGQARPATLRATCFLRSRLLIRLTPNA